MQIALTKKLADGMGLKFPSTSEVTVEDPIFCWTANWTNVWENRKTEDMLVLVNNATRFTVAIYEVKRRNLKNVAEMMERAIKNTLLAIGLDVELVDEYMRLAGEVNFVQNRNRQTSSWVSKAGLECAFYVGRKYANVAKMFSDTMGVHANRSLVNRTGSGGNDYDYPYEIMAKALSALTGKPAYKCTAYELLITLDLDIYKAVRRIIVPATMQFDRLHDVLQYVFEWKDYHLYDFTFFGADKRKPTSRIVPSIDALEYDPDAILMDGQVLSQFFLEYNEMIYTYDMGDDWKHEIRIVRIIEDCTMELPYLVEASGQAPPEDVGGVGGFVNFHEIMLNASHPEHKEMQNWAPFWSNELPEWLKKPRIIKR